MEIELDEIHHLAIQVKSIRRSVEWYKKKFKCNVNYQDKSWALLEFSNILLALVLPDQHPAHFAITRKNITMYGQPKKHRDGTSSVYIHDLDDNSIEMLKT